MLREGEEALPKALDTMPNNRPWKDGFGNGYTWTQDIAMAIIVMALMVVLHEFGHLLMFYAFTGSWGSFAFENGIILAVYPNVVFPAHAGICALGGLLLTLPFVLLWNRVGANTKMMIAILVGYAILEGFLGVLV